MPEQPTTPKGLRTRAKILDAALRLFRERGYRDTTMRAVAREAGVSLGNAYYYYASKEVLIQAFYERSHEEHLEACVPVLDGTKRFDARLRGVLRAKLETAAAYHRFAGVLFKTAADPASPLNPFSEASKPTRDASIALFEEVLRGSSTRAPRKLDAYLPELLWTYQMGVILYWVHDTSAGCERSYRLIDGTVPLVTRLIALAKLPVMRSFTARVLDLTQDILPPRSTRGGASSGR